MRCSVNDSECVPGRLRRGMCERHYRRMLSSGSTANPRIDNLSHYAVNEEECWVWQGGLWPNGYAKTSVEMNGTRLGHRAFYLEHVGPIPEGMDIDHMCHNADPTCERGPTCRHRKCVNPAHLAPASRALNLQRAIDGRLVCENGLHDLTSPGAVRPGTKQCVACYRARYRAASKRYLAKKRGRATS